MLIGVFLISVFFAGANSESVKGPSASDILSRATPSDWRKVDQAHVLYMDLAQGRVVMELHPQMAPEHVKNVKKLAREKYWDGLAIVRAQDNYVVQWGDPHAEDKKLKRNIKTAKDTLPAEFDREFSHKIPFTLLADSDTYAPEVGFSLGFPVGRDPSVKKMWLAHCYGALGVGRNVPKDSGGGAELYVVIGHAPRHLDRNVTVIGRVLKGIEHLSTLPRGTGALGFYEKTEERIPIQALRLGTDIQAKDRIELEMLKTDSKIFAELIEARKNRSEEWFHYQAGHVDVCNIPVPVRETIKK